MIDIGNKLEELSKAVPEIGIDEHLDPGVWTVMVGDTYYHIVTDVGKTLAIAAIRDWIVGQGFFPVETPHTVYLFRGLDAWFDFKRGCFSAYIKVWTAADAPKRLDRWILCALTVKEKME